MRIFLPKKWVKPFVFLLLFVLLITPAQAIGTPVKISTSSNAATFPQIVTDSKGYLHIAWMEVANDQVIWAAHQNPGIFYSRWNGDIWSAPLKISENTGFAEIPSITADGSDTIHVVWDDETYGSEFARVAYKTRSSTGTWSAIETLPMPAGNIVGWNSRVATDNSNVPHVVFSGTSNDFTQSILYWTRKVSGAWTTPEIISKDASNNTLADCQWSDLRQDNSGNIHIIYWCWTRGIHYRVFSSGTWSTPFQITDAGDIEYTRMTVTPAGQVFVVWFRTSDTSVRVRWTVSGSWQSELTLATNGDRSFWGFPIMGITSDSKERVAVGWGVFDPGDNKIDLKFRIYAAGSWGAEQTMKADMRDADSPFIYRDKWDNQHFAWTEKNETTGVWEIFYSVLEGTIQPVGPSGGTVIANPGNVTYATLTIPSGALSSIQAIAIQIGPVPESVDPNQVTIPRAWTFRPEGLVFNSAVTAVLTYTDSEVAGADETQLRPWVWNSQTSTWEARTGTVDTVNNTITISLTRFSLFGVSAPIVKTTWLTPLKDETVKQAALLFEFKLNYADGSEIVKPKSPEGLKVKVKGPIVKTIRFEPSGITRDEGKKTYKGTLFFERGSYPNGNYTLEVYLVDSLVDSQSFKLLR